MLSLISNFKLRKNSKDSKNMHSDEFKVKVIHFLKKITRVLFKIFTNIIFLFFKTHILRLILKIVVGECGFKVNFQNFS